MNVDAIETLFQDSIDGVDLCYAAKRINSTLILLYSGIDTASSLDKTLDGRNGRERYTGWCDSYLLTQAPFDFNSLELYAARCGVVHVNSAQSDLSRNGKVRELLYAWGNSKVDTLKEIISQIQSNKYVAVQLDDLIEAYGKSLDAFRKSLQENEQIGRASCRERV